MKVLVIGDSCLDKYVRGTCERLSPEFPVPVLKLEDERCVTTSPGMAANVTANLAAFGCDVDLVTHPENIIKTRFVDERTGHHLLRVDAENEVTPFYRKTIAPGQEFDHRNYDCVVISDYNKGFLTDADIQWIRKVYQGPVFLDTKKQDLAQFEGCIVKINQEERDRATSLCSNLIVTLGKDGATHGGQFYSAPAVKLYDVCGAGDTFMAT